MAYATQADIVEAYGPDALFMADRDQDGQPDAASVERALRTASSEIDSHIGVRHQLPLQTVPDILVQYAIDIALYRLSSSADVASEEQRQRYEDAIAALKLIAMGKSELIFPVDPNAPPADPEEDNSPRPIVASGPERVFSREKMEGL